MTRDTWDAVSRRLTAESRARAAACRRDHFDAWRVLVRQGNFSAFNGGRFTPSDYSALRCGECGRCWRTNAGYVGRVPDDFRGEYAANAAALDAATAAVRTARPDW